MTETPGLTLCVKWGSPEQTGQSDWKHPFLCLSQRDSHTVHRAQTSTSGCISSLTEKCLAPVWAATPKHSAGGHSVGWPHTPGHGGFDWSHSIQVNRSTGGIYGYNGAYSSFAEGWRGLLFVSGEKTTKKNTLKTPPKKATKTKLKAFFYEAIFIFRHLTTFPQYLLRASRRVGWQAKIRDFQLTVHFSAIMLFPLPRTACKMTVLS